MTYRLRGPNASWGLMKARAPAIPTLRTIDEDIMHQFRTIYRGTGHTDPSKEADVALLHDFYTKSKLHEMLAGRTVSNDVDKPKEVVSHGVSQGGSQILPKWVERRNIYDHSTEQTWAPSAEAQETEPAK